MITQYRKLSLQTGLLAAALLTTVASAQNVGIGTTTPKSKLSVNGSTASGGIAVGDATYTSTTDIVAPLNGAIVQGFTGIGTTNPLFRLSLEGSGAANWDSAVFVNSTAAAPTGALAPQVVLRVSNNAGLTANQIFGRFIAQSLPGGSQANATGMDALHRGFSGGGPLTALRFQTCDGTAPVERMRIDEDGNVGIADTTPTEARLVVRGNTAGNVGANRQFTQANTTLVADAGIAMGFSIYASNAIVAEGNVVAGNAIVAAASATPSDIRLKNVIGKSDGAADLEKLGEIEITNYTMKDPRALGAGVIKKVIAQQVEEVYPSAVSKTSGYLPDIQAPATVSAKGDGIFEIRMESDHHLEAGGKVKLFLPNGEPEFAVVKSAGEKNFMAKLELAKDGDRVFVHGRQVNDLRTVDYDALSMLNISATQELAKKVAALEAENARLREQSDKVTALSAKMEALEKLMAAKSAGEPSGTAMASH